MSVYDLGHERVRLLTNEIKRVLKLNDTDAIIDIKAPFTINGREEVCSLSIKRYGEDHIWKGMLEMTLKPPAFLDVGWNVKIRDYKVCGGGTPGTQYNDPDDFRQAETSFPSIISLVTEYLKTHTERIGETAVK